MSRKPGHKSKEDGGGNSLAEAMAESGMTKEEIQAAIEEELDFDPETYFDPDFIEEVYE